MLYELSFTAPVQVTDPSVYINDCCWGGDVICDDLLPLVSAHYQSIESGQEDWGWFIWFREGDMVLAIDIACDNIAQRKFRVLLASWRKKRLLGRSMADTPQLERLQQIVSAHLMHWSGKVDVEQVND